MLVTSDPVTVCSCGHGVTFINDSFLTECTKLQLNVLLSVRFPYDHALILNLQAR